ncbi:MAG: hypothetical protein WB711_13965 [Terriglobales bacterium]
MSTTWIARYTLRTKDITSSAIRELLKITQRPEKESAICPCLWPVILAGSRTQFVPVLNSLKEIEMSLSETERIIANQKRILQDQALILRGQEEIKRNQELFAVIVRNQEEILAGQRHCMYREALEEHLRSEEIRATTKVESPTHH